MDYYAQLFDVSVLDLSNRSGSSGNIILRLKNRIEELEDLNNEL